MIFPPGWWLRPGVFPVHLIMPAETRKIKKKHLKLTVFEAKAVEKPRFGPFFGEWTGHSPVKFF